MQLYALDQEQKVTFVKNAQRQCDYFCLECKEIVRLRGGIHRHTHFYHLYHTPHCRQNGKSMPHLQTQYFLLKLIPDGEMQMEVRFSAINRIADVLWVEPKIVFEIQCSPISATEVEQRNQDYACLGYRVVWILHDACFNQKRVSSAEVFLKTSPFYYTNIDANGEGYVYDQHDAIFKGVRMNKLPPLPISVSSLKLLDKDIHQTLPENSPQIILDRAHYPFYFEGDLLHRWLARENLSYFESILKTEAQFKSHLDQSILERLYCLFYLWMIRPYRIVFQMLLEKSCK